MAARPRSAPKRLLPPNLYQKKDGYYWFRNPITKETFGLGRNKEAAISQAKTANADIERRRGDTSLLARMDGGDNLLSKWCDVYEEALSGLKPNTMKSIRSQLAAIRADEIGNMILIHITPRDVVSFIERCEAERGAPMAAKIRSRLRDVLRAAMERGAIEVGKNPVEVTYKPKAVVKRSRLTLDTYRAILAEAKSHKHRQWVANAIELALVTGQRLEDICRMTFDNVHDGFLWVEQTKGRGTNRPKLCIPLSLSLPAAGLTLDDVVKRCRDRVVSKHLIHFSHAISKGKPGSAVAPGTLSQAFKVARNSAGIATEKDRTPPTFHELRSLAARLYSEAYGKDFAQSLLGHKSAAMTAVYRDSRGQDWTEIKISNGT
ncbi:TPA: tyrosine-type recombinase/integrase [Burkholderia multivorans]|uniref:tyrosine-type recombinase/integrase n=1 Tax=Burkholderia multivorans TaxID=87883 RepID=UPI001C247420|nr:tyrosine-type recombinase/integrase [Burkholderia multivorans]MBU9228243.1 tyrosine-type recombinase/integrase [Burkholderia multivorans]HDR9290080.1 tyrosine-type recombinase/integrase [Burkholderia multivorans]HDR9296083.1 tyrosine-type recombinase/integrase [Burkholderia multivorans]HDR9301634.1 tyrosine-type recombinase/integrase [Burkholderia multivorans]HDR9307143.1 tyrosine-type recombinase/integrase [Burkholderia multivorans]